MHKTTYIKAFALFSTLALAGCVAQAPPGSVAMTVESAPSATLSAISANAAQIGARTAQAGDNAIVVTYRGAPRDYIACADASGTAVSTRNLALDARSEFVQQAGSSRLTAGTQYIATRTRAAQSIEFSDGTSARFPSGLTCSATGTFPARLIGSPSG